MPREWLTNTRQDWERRANEALERSGSQERIDSRSWADRREDAMKRGDLEEAARCSRQPNVHLGPKELRHHDGKEQKDQRVRSANEEAVETRDKSAEKIGGQEAMIERIEQELRRIGQEISRLAKRVVELAAESLEIERREARRERQPEKQPAAREPEHDTVDKLLREQQRIWKLEDKAREAGPWGGQIEMEREAQQASNALWEQVCKLSGSERSEYERRESELERQQGRDRGGMSR